MSSESIQKVYQTHQQVIEEGFVKSVGQQFNKYAVTNLRGGVGKSSIAFNLAYEISRKDSLLVTDVCPQSNFTEVLLGGHRTKVDIYSALQPVILGPAFGDQVDDLSYKISKYCEDFKGGKGAWCIAGNAELFSFPSTLYQQLNVAYSARNENAVRKLLSGLNQILDAEMKDKHCQKALVDTSPFYAGGTHLAWCAVDALIVPVKVDEHSLESLELLFRQLTDPARDFMQWNERAGGLKAPKIAAIVMTMVGSKSQQKSRPDNASRMYIERAIDLCERYPDLFALEEPADAVVITDDFHSAGRISGAKRIPIAELKVRSFHTVENRRLQVNASVDRYKKQLKYLASMI
ncbi:ParA family protein [Pseudomonas piscis]|uniref:ParA family protein n=1 Tax=Pseudomonas piscis TaxID=2614538 RepID=UPI0021D600E8|nr:ParA family protein [Pseudomonas piscis]MCU7645622.1 ParA family protein [Pseudomonas piscis]